jgi:glycosyltransferase involved in cell wall biosynthesis
LTPCYNAGRLIELTVESVQAQTFPNWEMVICDDGSKDDSWLKLLEIAQQEPRLILVQRENGGAASATNAAFQSCSGEIVVFLDADDLCAPRRIEKIVDSFRRFPDAGFLTHRLRAIDSDGKPLGIVLPNHEHLVSGWFAPKIFKMAKYGCSAPSSGIAVRRQVMERIMPIPERCRRTQDAFVIGTSLLVTSAIGIDEELGYYRIHSGGQTSGQRFDDSHHHGKIRDHVDLATSICEFLDRSGHGELRSWTEECMLRNDAAFMFQIASYWLSTGKLHEFSPHNIKDVIRRLDRHRWFFEFIRYSPRFVQNLTIEFVRWLENKRR